MASSLRKRLGRRTAMPDLKPEDDDSGSSSESSLKATAPEAAKDSVAGQQPIAADDLSSTPPPNRKLRSSKDFSRDKTPPQALLEKYKGKSAKDAVATLSSTTAGKTSDPASRKDSHGDARPEKDSYDPARFPTTSQTRKVHGVEFDMLNQSKSNAETRRYGPTKGENKSQQPSGFQHRRTRSSTRREQRERASANSLDSVLLGDELKRVQLDTGLEPPKAQLPPALSIRKVERTPSPGKEDECEKDGEWVDVKSGGSTPRDMSPKRSTTTHSSASREATLNAALANLLPLPPPSGPGAPPSPLTYSPSPTPKRSILKNASSSNSSNLTIPVVPPVVPAAVSSLPKGYLWCSDKSTTSRPAEPWTWCKRWTCCSCGPPSGGDELSLLPAARNVLGLKGGMSGDGGEEDRLMNGRDEAKAATTMAEQRVCCRIACGHLRCGACCLVQEAKFVMTSGPFAR